MSGARVRPWPAVPVALVVGWVGAGLEPFATSTTVVVLALGLATMAVGHAQVPVGRSADPPGRRAPWGALAVALAAWQLVAYVQEPRSDHPTLSSLTNETLDARPMRAIAFAAWLLGGAWLARRR